MFGERLLAAHPVRRSVQRELNTEHRITFDLTSYRRYISTTNDVIRGKYVDIYTHIWEREADEKEGDRDDAKGTTR